MRFEDAGLEDIMDEGEEINEEINAEVVHWHYDYSAPIAAEDEAIDMEILQPNANAIESDKQTQVFSTNPYAPTTIEPNSSLKTPPLLPAGVRTLDGEIAGDESAADAANYQILLGKLDMLLDRLKLDA